jgi:hypothetical protein
VLGQGGDLRGGVPTTSSGEEDEDRCQQLVENWQSLEEVNES